MQEFFVASGLSRFLKNSPSRFENLRVCSEFLEGALDAHLELIEPFRSCSPKHCELFSDARLIKCRYSLFTDPLISTQGKACL